MVFEATHGVYDHEKTSPNTFEVDTIFENNFELAAKTDELQNALDYSKIHGTVSQIMHGSPKNLIETLCFDIGQALFAQFKPHKLTVKIRKLAPPMHGTTDYSEITMQWPRQ